MMYKQLFNLRRPVIRFRHFTRKKYALFASLGRVVIIGVLSVATLQSATAAHRHMSTNTEETSDTTTTVKEATLDDLEVTASRAPLAIGQAVRMVTVLSREDIQAAPVQSINDLLKTAVGIDVRQRGPMGAQTDIGIRGSTQEQITVLLNGVNICDPQTGHNTFDLPCDISDIVRIEVLEGPAGRVYGTSSLQGAINVITRQNVKEEGSTHVMARMEGGSFGYLSGAASVSNSLLFDASSQGRSGVLQSHFSAGAGRSDGYSRAKSGALNADYQGGKAFYQGSCDTEGLRLHWHAGLSTKGYGSNTFWSANYDEQYEHTTKLFTALQGETTGPFHFHPAVYWNRSYDRFELIRGDQMKVPFNRHRTDVFGISLNSWFDWGAGRTALGAEYRNEDISSSNLGEPLHSPHHQYKCGLNRSNLSFHLEHNIQLKCLTLSAGFIATKNTWAEMPFRIYPGMDACLRITQGLRLYASYNSSLRMPSFTELYYSVGGHKADKHLKPEELQAIEGGMKYSSRWVTAQACVFHHHARNLIDWVMDTREADPVWQSVNHTQVNTLGEEVSATFFFPHSSFLISYCHLHQQKQESAFLQSRYSLEYLRHKLTSQFKMHLTENLDLTLGYRWQDRTGSYTDTAGKIQDYRPYSIIDARLSWTTATWSIYLDGNNLTGHRYVDYGNVPQPGCWMKVGVKINIG